MHQYLFFTLNDNEYAISTEYVVKELPIQEILKFPSMPKHFSGCVRHEGVICPVLNLKRLFDIPKHADINETGIIVLKNNSVFGVLADQILGTSHLEMDETITKESVKKIANKDYIESLGMTEHRLTPTISVDFLKSYIDECFHEDNSIKLYGQGCDTP